MRSVAQWGGGIYGVACTKRQFAFHTEECLHQFYVQVCVELGLMASVGPPDRINRAALSHDGNVSLLSEARL